MGERTAFFYGTLMAPEVLYRVCYGTHKFSADNKFKADLAAALKIKPAILHNYCRHKVQQADYPGIIAENGHTVRGTYVTGLTEHDIMMLDMFEGSEYRRREVKVMLLKLNEKRELVESEGVETETYVFTAGRHRLEDEEWDYDEFRKEKLHRWVDQSVEYEEVDELAANGHDPTGGRGFQSATPAYLNEFSGDEDEEVLQSTV